MKKWMFAKSLCGRDVYILHTQHPRFIVKRLEDPDSNSYSFKLTLAIDNASPEELELLVKRAEIAWINHNYDFRPMDEFLCPTEE